MAHFKIQHAKENDVSIVMNFITELAKHENIMDRPIISEENLKELLFGSTQYAESIIGYLDDKPISFVLFYHNVSTSCTESVGLGMVIEDFYVNPEFRSQGIGKKMLAYLGQLAEKRKCSRLQWVVLDYDKSAESFYKRIGAKKQHEWMVYSIASGLLKNL